MHEKKILIFGTGESKNEFVRVKSRNVNIIAYVDNNYKKWNKTLDGVEIIQPQKINQYKYDYIVIASQYVYDIYNQLISMGISEDKIFKYKEFTGLKDNYIEQSLIRFKNGKNITVVITGTSYAMLGIEPDLMKYPSHRFAYPSQDLYYDYNIMKLILKNKINSENIRYCIIGLCYYSFHYDMSLSAMKNKCIYYYKLLGERHNFKEIDEYIKKINVTLKIGDILVDKDKLKKKNCKPSYRFIMEANKEEKGAMQAKLDSNKHYPDTVKENFYTLDAYIKMLLKYKIKPILVVFPTTSYYNNNFNETLANEFLNLIYKLTNKYNVQFLDYFKSEKFSDFDFYDVSHLNKNGAKKMVCILNEDIEW